MTAPRDALAQLEAVLELSEYDVLPVMDHPLSPRNGDGPESAMTEWIAASVKPRHDGPYLRQFDDGDALSWWYEGRWNADSFFAGASDIQDAPWRGFSPSGLFLHQHAETLRAILGAADGVRLTESDVVALVAGPYMYHHKMNDLQTRYAEGFDRCREMTIDSIKTRFAIEATLTKAPAND